MTHDEYLKAAATSEPLTAEQEQLLREHIENCSECDAEDPLSPDRHRSHGWWLGTAAVFFLALWIWREAGIRVARERLRSDRAEIGELSSAKDVLQQQKEKLVQGMDVIAAPDVRIFALTGQPGGSARLFVDGSKHRAVLAAAGLKTSVAGADYQIWLYGSDPAKPKSGPSFDVVNGHANVLVEDIPADLKSITVTIEKSGGATTPGTAVVLSGTM